MLWCDATTRLRVLLIQLTQLPTTHLFTHSSSFPLDNTIYHMQTRLTTSTSLYTGSKHHITTFYTLRFSDCERHYRHINNTILFVRCKQTTMMIVMMSKASGWLFLYCCEMLSATKKVNKQLWANIRFFLLLGFFPQRKIQYLGQ